MTENKKRLQQLLEMPLRIFYHPIFDNPKERKNILSDMPGLDKFKKDNEKITKIRLNGKITPEMLPCYEAPLLNIEQEQHLFRKMNYFKYKVKKHLAKINLDNISEKRLSLIELDLANAIKIRNQIAESNFRLATQLLRSQITFYREHSLTDALLSDAYFDVLKAVDYFNWTLGNRFSTYATWVIKKNFFRDSKQKITQAEKCICLDEIHAEKIQSRSDGFQEEKDHTDRQQFVQHLLHLLSIQEDNNPDRLRQVYVLEHYFGVNGKERHTLEEISVKIGLTKERVRQLKEKGLIWIREQTSDLII